MTAWSLLKRRVRENTVKRWRAYRFGLPVLLFVLGYPYMLLVRGEIDWAGDVPLFVWTALFLLLIISDPFFIWVERADVSSTGTLIKTLKRYSLSYHGAKLMIKYGVVVLLFSPVLVERGWTSASIVSFFLSILFIAWLHMWTRYQLKIRDRHWTSRAGVTVIASICFYALLDTRPLVAVVFGSGSVALALCAGEGWLSRQPYLNREIDLAEARRASPQNHSERTHS